MGAWGADNFSNDAAMNWFDYLEQQENAYAFIASTLEQVTQLPEDDYLEAPESSEALAAAEILAAIKGAPTSDLPASALAWVSAHSSTLDRANLIPLAIQAINRVSTNSELSELWEERANDDHAQDWYDHMASLRARLTSLSQ